MLFIEKSRVGSIGLRFASATDIVQPVTVEPPPHCANIRYKTSSSSKGGLMKGDANEYTEADAQLLAVNVSDEELERAGAVSNNGSEYTVAHHCYTYQWLCPL